MRLRDAKKLHSHDEIIVKRTGEVTEVVSVEMREKDVLITAMTRNEGYTTLRHTEVR